MPLGFTPVNWQERIDTQRTQITWVTDIQQGLALLYQERVDGLDLEYFVSQRSAPLSYEQNAFTLDLTLPHNEIPFSLSTLYHQDIISELNKFISSNPELIDSIKTKYGITPFEQLSQKLLIEQGLKIEEVWKQYSSLCANGCTTSCMHTFKPFCFSRHLYRRRSKY